MKVLAGIVLFNPDQERLIRNVSAILPQVEGIVCVDNGSENLEAVRQVLPGNIDYIENGQNLGIAAALNQILEYAWQNGYTWCLTLDQDSVCEQGLVREYRRYTDLAQAGLLTCRIVDRNFVEIEDAGEQRAAEEAVEIESCITSASFCNVGALRAVGGFDEQMFIDSVDFDMCMNLREHGYRIYRIPFTGLLHEVGHGRNVRLLWRKYIVYNHSPLRNYYIARNHVYMAQKYPDRIPMSRTRLKELETRILILLYEKEKLRKLAARRQGIRDAKRGKMGKCSGLEFSVCRTKSRRMKT